MSKNFQSILINIVSKKASCEDIVILDWEDASTYSVLAHVPCRTRFTVTIAEVLMYM